MEHNPYLPPVARVEDLTQSDADAQFLVVAPRKFWIMTIGTLGLYGYYWFYKNWALLNRQHKTYWPVARAIFSIFFTHSLFAEVDAALRRRGAVHAWSPRGMATQYVVCSIASNICDKLAARDIGSPLTDVAGLLLLLPICGALYEAQRAINIAEGDTAGERNRSLTPANFAWLVLGGLLWLLLLLGLFVMATGGFE
jgi:hypothetical protein